MVGKTTTVSQLNSDSYIFDRNYNNLVIFIQPLLYNGTQPAIVRIEDIQTDRTAFTRESTNENNSYNWKNINTNDSFLHDGRNDSTNDFQITAEIDNYSYVRETVDLTADEGNDDWSQNNSAKTSDNEDRSWYSYNSDSDWSDLEIEDTPRDRDVRTTEAIDLSLDGNTRLMASQIGETNKSSDIRSCQLDLIRIGDHESTVWSNNEFDGEVCREITGDVTNFSLTVDIEEGGFDTSIAAVNPRVRVDEVNFGNMSFNVDVDLEGSGAWWVGPKIDIRKNKSGGTDGWYENYVVENASRSPEEYHERLTDDGIYLGQSDLDGATYRHYFTPHNSWNQFWAIRQDYRSSGSVNMDTIIDMWRDNGLPNDYITILKNNIETSGEVNGMVEMSGLDIPSW